MTLQQQLAAHASHQQHQHALQLGQGVNAGPSLQHAHAHSHGVSVGSMRHGLSAQQNGCNVQAQVYV